MESCGVIDRVAARARWLRAPLFTREFMVRSGEGAVRMGIAWVASYPKSGNTWVRFLLANYLAGPITDTAQIEPTVPSYHHETDFTPHLARWNPLCIKTHFPWSPHHPLAAQTQKAIVVVRYPKDILLSNLNYHRMVLGTDDGFDDAQYARAFIAAGGDPVWLKKTNFGTLESHIASWLDNPAAPPHLVVRYESLVRNAAAELSRMLGFLGLPRDPARILQAVADSSFDRMRDIEVREKAANRAAPVFPGVPPREGWSRLFMNQGRVGGTLAHIGPDLDRLFDERFEELMSRLGYDALAQRSGSPYPFAAQTGAASNGAAALSPDSSGLSRSA